VILIGFSGGAAYAGGLLLSQPERFLGTAVLFGTLPFDAGVPTTPGHLGRSQVLAIQGEDDHVIPAELLERTCSYLGGESGASARIEVIAGGHQLSSQGMEILIEWLDQLSNGHQVA
jgi:phospholipase/carboxylesterase